MGIGSKEQDRSKMKSIISFFAAALLVQSCVAQEDIVDTLTTLGLTDLKNFLDTAELTDTLKNGDNFTLFAPTNEGFAALDQSLKDRLNSDKAFLTDVLLYHVLGIKAPASSLSNELLVDSLLTGKQVRINIYGNIVTATGSQVTNADQMATNGIIHVVDSPLLAPTGTVVEFAVANGFNNLTDLVTAAGLVDALSTGNLTVFAPTNAAFGKLSKEVLDELAADKDKLTKVLTYHVIGSTRYNKGFGATQDLPTLNGGETLTITKDANGVKVNNFAVTLPEASATNGVVYQIGDVLVPDGVIGAAWGVQPSLLVLLTSALLGLLYRL